MERDRNIRYEKDYKNTFEDRNTFKGFVFLLNADCSFCVKQFLDFIIYLNEKNIHMPLIVVVEEGDT